MLLNVLLTFLIIDAVALTGVILLQRSEGGALGMGGGSQFMTARGASDLLTKTTQFLGAGFFILSLLITVLTGRVSGTGSVVDRVGVDDLDASTLNRPAPTQPVPTGTPTLPGFQAPLPSTGAPAAPSGVPAPVIGFGAPIAPAPAGTPPPAK